MAMRRNSPRLLSVRSQMLVEKMNAFYLKNWDKEEVFDISQRVIPRMERHWVGKQGLVTAGAMKNWKYTYSATPYHKSDDGQSPGDITSKNVKKKYFWVDPPADMYRDQNLPGGERDFQLAWEEFYKELEAASYAEPEQVLTLLHDLINEGWTVPEEAYEKADNFLVDSRKRRVLGIKPPILIQSVEGKERWPGQETVPFEEEWDPIRPYTIDAQSNPAYTYKPIMEKDWVHDPAPWRDGPLPLPTTTRDEDRLKYSPQRRAIMLQEEADERFKQLLQGQNRDIYERFVRDPTSFAGDPAQFGWLQENQMEVGLTDGVPLLLHTDINHFIELFYHGHHLPELIFFWKYTSDHILLRHFVFEKTGKTLLEFSEPERFAILHAILDLKKNLLFEGGGGSALLECHTDADYIKAFGEDVYRQFLRMEGRRIDEERRKYQRLWSTEIAKEERLDQVVELTRMRQEDEYRSGVFGTVARVRDRMDRRKWAIKEPSRQVQEHERFMTESAEDRRALFDDEMADLHAEATLAYGDEVYGRQTPKIGGKLPENRRTPIPDREDLSEEGQEYDGQQGSMQNSVEPVTSEDRDRER
eukprot:TRINITY_DN32240_c0_g1_i1.p1 TRINITY_DN32240_c0_g1~~TRINITY_DN32240_c0_g1_i1.p1  ORF type:complete len:608 (+),score=265.54 TRINITY_DN32240_c0_g1_i1:67-1824(+)